jgi:hypothetical protein
MGEWRYGATILELGTRRRCVVSFTHPADVPVGKYPRYQLDRMLGGPQGQYESCGGEKFSYLCRESNPGRQTRSLSLYRLIRHIKILRYFCDEGNVFAVLKDMNLADIFQFKLTTVSTEAYSYEESSVLLST